MNPDHPLSRLQSMHAGSSLPGPVPAAVEPGKEQSGSKMDRLSEACRSVVLELSDIQANHPVRVYESQDGLQAGIICPDSFKADRPEVFARVSRLFFGPHHAEICTVFETELRATARKNRRCEERG